MFKRYDLLIINRSFWPLYPVIGEGLLRLAESLASHKKVAVISQDHNNIKKSLKKFKRGVGVKFFPIWAFTNSSSRLIKRILEALFFSIWILICLIITRPKNIYVSTDPPVLVPFVISVYSMIMRTKYVYHLQDIHPNPTLGLNSYLYNMFKSIDNFTLQNANLLITLNEKMKAEIIYRSKTKKEIVIIENPSVPINIITKDKKKKGFSFTGNLGRVQIIPLLIDAINEYEQRVGTLRFEFAGDGLFSKDIDKLSKSNSLVKYHGLVSSDQAIKISSDNEWGLVPIEDEITRYSFPSKISSYICSGAKILAICGENTSVAQWVTSNKVGIAINPNLNKIVDTLFKIEKNNFANTLKNFNPTDLQKRFDMDRFVKNIQSKVI